MKDTFDLVTAISIRAELMEVYEVSRLVNDPRNDSPAVFGLPESTCNRSSRTALAINCLSMTPTAKDKLAARLLDLTIGVFVLMLPGVLLLVENHLELFVSQLSLKIIIRAGITLLSLLAWLCFLLWRFWPRLKFDARWGIYIDKRSGLLYCASCHSKKLRSPLREEENGWRCVIKECGMFYSNPDYVRKRPPSRVSETNSRD